MAKNVGLPSPCISICRFKSYNEKVCIGCGRTQKQIRNWMNYSVEQRKEIIEYLKETHVFVPGGPQVS